jgi:hypothetical protein
MKPLIFILFLLPIFSISQDFGEHIKENAIEIKDINKLDQPIYDALSTFELITVGEMHGTKEPANCVKSLSTLILEKEGEVSVGLEIPDNQLTLFIENPTPENLLNSVFFSKENIDGRNGSAWYNLILYCINDTNINLFFFDNHSNYNGVKRDSVMYLGIKEQKINHPNSKIITLSGNIHNSRIPFNEMTTMGMYCLKDTLNFSSDKICSIHHVFSEGTMLNNTGNGLELRTIPFEDNIFSTSINFQNYLIHYNFGSENRYNCIIYTRKVSQSERL